MMQGGGQIDGSGGRIGEFHQFAESLVMKKSFWIAVRIFGFVFAPIMGAVTTLGLFIFMQALINGGEEFDHRPTVVKLVDATMPVIEMVVYKEIDKPEPIQDLSEQEPELVKKQITLNAGPSLNIQRGLVEMDTDLGLDLSMATISAADGDYLPLVHLAPQYPSRARDREIEGWCIVSFTVGALGNVIEDSIMVVDAEPREIFNRASMRAAARFKFQPRVRDGVGIEVSDVQYLFTFKM